MLCGGGPHHLSIPLVGALALSMFVPPFLPSRPVSQSGARLLSDAGFVLRSITCVIPVCSPCLQSSKGSAARLLSMPGSSVAKLLWSTGKAAWIAGTTFLILCVPLIIEMDREQQLIDT